MKKNAKSGIDTSKISMAEYRLLELVYNIWLFLTKEKSALPSGVLIDRIRRYLKKYCDNEYAPRRHPLPEREKALMQAIAEAREMVNRPLVKRTREKVGGARRDLESLLQLYNLTDRVKFLFSLRTSCEPSRKFTRLSDGYIKRKIAHLASSSRVC